MTDWQLTYKSQFPPQDFCWKLSSLCLYRVKPGVNAVVNLDCILI